MTKCAHYFYFHQSLDLQWQRQAELRASDAQNAICCRLTEINQKLEKRQQRQVQVQQQHFSNLACGQ